MIEHLQINDVAPCVHYDADGVQAAFTFPFAVFKAADLEVWVDKGRLATGFTVSGAGISSGGAVLFSVPPAVGSRVTLRRRIALERISDFQTDGIIRAKTLNDELDYQVAAVQQVADDLSRCLQRPFTSASTADLSLPDPLPGRGVKWNADGSALVNTVHDPDSIPEAAIQMVADRQSVAEDRQAIERAAADAQVAAGQAVAAASSVANPLDRTRNLGDLDDAMAARANLGLAAVAQQADLSRVESVLGKAADNLFLTTLRMIANAGSTYLKMVDGFADEFEDVTGTAVNVAVGGTALQNSQYLSYGAAYAFDSQDNTYWASNEQLKDSSGVCYVGYTLPQPMVVRRVRLNVANSPSSWSVQYYNGSAWVTACTCSVTGQDVDYDIPAIAAPASSWRLLSASNTPIPGSIGAQSISVRTVEFFAEAKAVESSTGIVYDAAGDFFTNLVSGTVTSDMVLRSRLYFPTAQPIAGRIVAIIERLDPLVHGTDNALRMSRNGGTSFSDAPVQVEAVGLIFNGHLCDIVSATFDLAAQPAGAAIRVEFRTSNGKRQRIHGWYVDVRP